MDIPSVIIEQEPHIDLGLLFQAGIVAKNDADVGVQIGALGQNITIDRHEIRVAANIDGHRRVNESPLALGRIRESVVFVGSALSEEEVAPLVLDSATEGSVGIVADIDLDCGEGPAGDAFIEVAVDEAEVSFHFKTDVVAEDDAHFGVGYGIIAASGCGDGARSGY